MTPTVDISEGAARLAAVGSPVVIMQGTDPVAKIEKVLRVPHSILEE